MATSTQRRVPAYGDSDPSLLNDDPRNPSVNINQTHTPTRDGDGRAGLLIVALIVLVGAALAIYYAAVPYNTEPAVIQNNTTEITPSTQPSVEEPAVQPPALETQPVEPAPVSPAPTPAPGTLVPETVPAQ